jgi:uncharacterized RDD family membrane protein YckC
MNTHIKEAGFGKRLIAYLIDAFSVIILTVILFNFVTSKFLYSALGGNAVGQEMYHFAEDSELLSAAYADDGTTITGVSIFSFTDSTGMSSTPAIQKKTGYEEYYDRAWYYYTHFIYEDSTTKGRAIAKTDTTYNTTFTADQYYTYFEKGLLGLPDLSEITSADLTNEEKLAGTNAYFKYALNDAGTAVDIHKMPVLRSTIDTSKATTLTLLNTYMYDSTGSNSNYGIYGNAVIDLMGGDNSHTSIQTYYSSRYSEQNKDLWICALVVFAPLQLIFFLVIPLCRKKGETLGKMAMGIAVVKIDGFNVTWKEKLIRQFAMTTLGMLVMLPWTYIGAMLFVLISIVDYMVLVMSKTHQSLHDRLAKTMAVEKKESLFFDDEGALVAYAAAHPEQFPELKNPEHEQENSQIAAEDSILDLSTLNKNRDEAKAMTSFDDYEKKKEEENASKTPVDQPKVNLTKEDEEPGMAPDEQAMKDLAALEGGVPDEKGEVTSDSSEKDNPAEAKDKKK